MTKIKNVIFKILLYLVRWEAVLLFSRKKINHSNEQRIAVLEPCPTSSGSNGDEALIDGTCRFLNEKPDTVVEVISFYDQYDGHLPKNTVYGGSLYKRSDGQIKKIIRYFTWPFMLSRYDGLYVIGADLIDGYYSDSVSNYLFYLLDLGDKVGVKGNLISCSFNDSPPPAVQRSMNKYLNNIRVNTRDAYSAARLSTVLGRDITHSADVAFGLLPDSSAHGKEIVHWTQTQKEAGRKVIALNVNLLPVTKQFAGRENEYIRQWGVWLEAMVEKGFSFVLLSHDYRSEWGDEVALIKLLEESGKQVGIYCYLPEIRLHAGEIKYIVSNCDLTVTGRMHLAIASMGSGVPVIAYAYQGKFEGILRLFGLEDNVRSMLSVFEHINAELIFAEKIASEIDISSSRVESAVDSVLALARKNIN